MPIDKSLSMLGGFSKARGRPTKALGLTVPLLLLAQADEVIE
jgi:hypothetical protein